MHKEFFVRGFVKKALKIGLSEDQALEVLKSSSSLPVIQGASTTPMKFVKFDKPKAPAFGKIPGTK